MKPTILISNTEYHKFDESRRILKGIAKCLEYVEKEQQENFKNLISQLHIDIKQIGTAADFPKYESWDPNNAAYRHVYMVTIKRNEQKINFTFCDSFSDSVKGIKPDLYDILACISSDYDFNNLDFNDFCDEFGYNNDSIKAKDTYHDWKIQDQLLHKIFNDSDIEALPR